MIKLTGSLLILLGSLFAGYYPLHILKSKIRVMFCLRSLFKKMAAKLRISAIPIPEMISELYAETFDSDFQFLSIVQDELDEKGAANFDMCWNTAVDITCRLLDVSLRNHLKELGTYLGRYSLEDEIKILDNVSDMLSEEERYLKNKYQQIRKAVMCGSFSVGLMIIILLV